MHMVDAGRSIFLRCMNGYVDKVTIIYNYKYNIIDTGLHVHIVAGTFTKFTVFRRYNYTVLLCFQYNN